jgi:hypothetical protein
MASWKKLTIPKAQVGWGLMKIYLFSKELATKNVCKLIEGYGLWDQFIKDKYIPPNIMEEWVRNMVKSVGKVGVLISP